MSIEELMNIEVTSVSRKAESLANAAAAVFVITQEDIRRSGVTAIPDLFRMVPGLDVGSIDSNKWAISSRGFNGRFANKMLVLLDGRTVYTPLYSGVWWDQQDMMLEDIARIEIIRGPGATLWGANAVNGVINIITKKASETVGGLITAGGGNRERGIGGARYGVRVGSDTSLRVYAKYRDKDGGEDVSGREVAGGWHALRGGFRMDTQVTGTDAMTLQGDMYNGSMGEIYTLPLVVPPYASVFDSKSKNSGGNVLTRWNRIISESSDIALQLYYDHTDEAFALLGEKRDTFDMDFQHRFGLRDRHNLVWGAGYRFTHDNIDNSPTVSLSPESQANSLFSIFVQDDITIIAERLRMTLGSKFEHNDYTGFEVQPNVRAIWTPNDRNSVWAAVSQAVRIPSRAERGVRAKFQTVPPSPPDQPFPILVAFKGSHVLQSEKLTAYEFGYRAKPKDFISFDMSAFFNNYDKLVSLNAAPPSLNDLHNPSYMIVTFSNLNNMDAVTYGFELASDVSVYNWWRIHGGYTYLKMKTHLDDQSVDLGSTVVFDPRHQFSIRSQFDLGHTFEFDLWLRYVDSLPAANIKSYITPDVRLCWKLSKNIELSLVGHNLTHDHRLEFMPELINTLPTVTERSFFGKVAWSY